MIVNLRSSLGLEDNDIDVEINFNVDNNDDDDNGLDVEQNTEGELEDEDGIEGETDEVADAKSEAIEAEAEEERSEAEVEELEEAQEALESLQAVIDKQHSLSLEEFEMFKLTMSNITKNKPYLEVVSQETIFQSDFHRKMVANEIISATLENLNQVSMEAKESLWQRAKEKFDRFKDLERAIVKKATALRELASASTNEKADIEYIKFDDKNTPKFNYIRTNRVNSFNELMKDLKKAESFFRNLKTPNIGAGDDKAIVSSMLNFTEGWELVNGMDTIEFFTISITKNSDLSPDKRPSDKDIEQLPILTAKECEEVLESVLELSKYRGKVTQLIGILQRLDKSSGKFQYSAKAAFNGVKVLQDVRVQIMDELVKYANVSLNHLGAD